MKSFMCTLDIVRKCSKKRTVLIWKSWTIYRILGYYILGEINKPAAAAKSLA